MTKTKTFINYKGIVAILFICIFIFSAFSVQSRNTDYIKEMPSVERVKQTLQGRNELETNIKHYHAFVQLMEMIYLLSDHAEFDNSLTAAEKRFVNDYNNELKRIDSRVSELIRGRGDEGKIIMEMHSIYLDEKYYNEVLIRFFSAQWRLNFRSALKKSKTTSTESINQSSGESNSNQNIFTNSNIEANNDWNERLPFLLISIILGICAYILFRKNKNELKEKKWYQRRRTIIFLILLIASFLVPFALPLGMKKYYVEKIGYIFFGYIALILIYGILKIFGFGKEIKEVAENKRAIKKLQEEFDSFISSFGSNKSEREKTFKKIFDNKQGTLRIPIYHVIGRQDYSSDFISFTISRNVAAMEQKEREFMRTAFLLHNEGKIDNNNLRYYLFSFINGDGKGSIDNWNCRLTLGSKLRDEIKNGVSAVKYYQDLVDGSVDSAVNNLMQIVEHHNSDNNQGKVLKEIKNRIRGGGQWFGEEDIEGSIFKITSSYNLTLGKLEESDAILSYSGEGSLITIAPPGSGKTQCFVIPNMLNWQGAAVVLDIKGEIYAATNKWREKNVGKVFKFSPLDPNNSNSYNPLVFIRNEPDYIWEDSRFLADMMIVPTNATDPFWENTARDVLTAAIAYTSFNNEPNDRHMSKVLDIIYGIGWDEMIVSLKTNVLVSAMRQTGASLANMENKMKDSVLKTAQSSLSAWQGERIAKVTKKSDWSPLDLRNGSPTIYICINPNEIDSYLSVLRVFIAQHIRMLTSELPERGASPVLFMLDEMPRLKKMPPIEEALNIGRQYGIKLWMFAQSYGQLKEAYPNAEGILGSCVVRTFMNLPLNDEITTKISDQLGYREGPLDASKQKLVEPMELAGPNYRDIILVLATNTKPAKVRKEFAYEDKILIERMN